MMKLVTGVSYIVTENELEALVLEANLIKQYRPRFNIVLRDDKNYPYLKLTMAEEWPRLEVVRRIVKDGSIYFGPYVPAQSMWNALAFIRRNFPIRVCKYSLDRPMRPCIQHQMGRCPAPCADKIGRAEYLRIVEEVRLFLSGERSELLKTLEEKMLALSEELKFEEAARIRDRISHITQVWESQRVVSYELGDIDVIGYYTDKTDAVFDVFFIRNGIVIGAKDFFLKEIGGLSEPEALHGFIELFYAKEIIPPDELIVKTKPAELKNLRTWLKTKKGETVRITVPRDGKKQELIQMALENAEVQFQSRRMSAPEEKLASLKERLSLPRIPRSIGAFDVSTTGGSESVGAFVYWRDNEFVKELYRHVRIRAVPGIDDYAMMDELITRTLKNLGENIPDLIVIDGGKGHLETARKVITSNSFTLTGGSPPMFIAVAKDPDRAVTSSTSVVDLEDGDPASLLLKRIRDEVHRFAVSFHRKLRDRKLMESPLEKVPGIGKKRRFELLRVFGSIEAVRNATVDEIRKIKGFNTKVAEDLLRELRRQ